MSNIITICLRFFFYISVILQWMWTFIVFLPALIDSGFFKLFMAPEQPVPAPTEPLAPSAGVEPLAIAFALLITALIIIATIIFFIRLPKAVAETGEKTVKKTATKIVPIVTHHKKLSKKKQQQLTERTIYIIQLSLIGAPLLLLIVIGLWAPSPLDPEVTRAVGTFLAIWPLLWLTLVRVMPHQAPKRATKAKR